ITNRSRKWPILIRPCVSNCLLMTSLFEKEAVQALLPQKNPFVMVDALFSYAEDSLVSGFTADDTNLFASAGYFTESGLIEHMAQSVALHTGYSFFLKKQP